MTTKSLPPLPEVAVTVPAKDYTPALHSILAAIKPQWKPEQIKIKVMSQGFANQLYRASVEGDGERLMVRVFGTNEGIGNCYDRESELAVLQVLAAEGVNTPVYAKFENGYVYGFATGDTLTREDLKDEAIRKKALELVLKLHHIDYKAYLGEIRRPGWLVFIDEPWKIIDKSDFSDIEASAAFKENFPPIAECRKIKDDAKKVYDELCKKYPLVYSHGDLHIHNMVYNRETGSMTFIDWEDLNLCPEILDPTTIFDRDPEFSDTMATSEDRRMVLKEFLSMHPVYGQKEITEAMLDEWYIDSLKMSLVTQVEVVSFCLVSMKTSQEQGVDWIEFGSYFHKGYLKYKKELDELTK